MSTPAEGAPAAQAGTPAPASAEQPGAQTPTQAPAVDTPVPQAPVSPKLDNQPVAIPDAPVSSDDGGTVSYEATGDTALDVALAFIGKLGIGSAHPAMQAAMQNDFALLKATLATMGDKAQGWEQIVALAEQANQRAGQARDELATKVQNAVIAVAGSQENWDAVKQWAAINADPAEKEALNAMFDAGPVQARAAAMLLMQAYSKASGTVVNPANPTRNLSGGNPVQNNGALSSRDYAAEVRKLHDKLGNRMEASPEYHALRARHAAYRG